ncbi:MAG: hypothetical protein PHI86_03150 [Candidatus Omnitrophica bacterium]|nr:hypothetical protein [Candidatus Omnitrophota bacterium]HOX53985.1 hypothetical protein [Candidatus Omnitrophota bacterium]
METAGSLTAIKVLMRILLTFSFAGSLFVVVDVEAYRKLNQFLMREYGLTKRIIPMLENVKSTLEDYILKNRRVFGAMFLLLSFVLLTLY